MYMHVRCGIWTDLTIALHRVRIILVCRIYSSVCTYVCMFDVGRVTGGGITGSSRLEIRICQPELKCFALLTAD